MCPTITIDDCDVDEMAMNCGEQDPRALSSRPMTPYEGAQILMGDVIQILHANHDIWGLDTEREPKCSADDIAVLYFLLRMNPHDTLLQMYMAYLVTMELYARSLTDNPIEFARGVWQEMLDILSAKNKDYGGGASDPFKNIRVVEDLSICTMHEGVLVRLADKVSRFGTLVAAGGERRAVKEESLQDTLKDILGYLSILRAMTRMT